MRKKSHGCCKPVLQGDIQAGGNPGNPLGWRPGGRWVARGPVVCVCPELASYSALPRHQRQDNRKDVVGPALRAKRKGQKVDSGHQTLVLIVTLRICALSWLDRAEEDRKCSVRGKASLSKRSSPCSRVPASPSCCGFFFSC